MKKNKRKKQRKNVCFNYKIMLLLQRLQYRSFTAWLYSAFIARQGKVEETGIFFAHVKVLDPFRAQTTAKEDT